MKRADPKVLASVAVLAVLVLAAALHFGRGRGDGASLDSPDSTGVPDFARDPPLPAVESSAGARASVTPATPESSESPETAPTSSEVGTHEDRIVRGTVVDLEDAPLRDAEVVWLDGARPDPSSPESASPSVARTDEAGRFELRLDPERWHWGDLGTVWVSNPDSRRLFSGAVRLEPGLRIVARTRLKLRGTILCNRDLSDRKVHVTAEVPATGAISVAIHAGAAPVNDGRFEIEAAVDSSPDEFLVKISVADAGVFRSAVSTRELVSDVGATIRIELSELECLVVDEGQIGIEGAKVHVASASDPEGPEIRAMTDVDGRVRLLPPSGSIEICLGKPGFAAHVETFDPAMLPEATRTFRLRKLGPDDVVEGRVVLEDGSGVANVFVSANPVTVHPELLHPGFASTRSGPDGRFSVPIGSNGEVEVRGYDREHGMTQEVTCEPGGPSVTLLLRKHGRVRIRLDCDAIAGPFLGGELQYVFVDRDYDNTLSGHDWGVPFEVDEVPEGDYNAFVLVPGMDGVGQTAFRLDPGERKELLVSLEPVRWVAGRIVSSDGAPAAGLRLIARLPSWPAEACELLARATTDRDGRFRLLGGTFDEVLVEVVGRERATSWTMSAAEQREWRLP